MHEECGAQCRRVERVLAGRGSQPVARLVSVSAGRPDEDDSHTVRVVVAVDSCTASGSSGQHETGRAAAAAAAACRPNRPPSTAVSRYSPNLACPHGCPVFHAPRAHKSSLAVQHALLTLLQPVSSSKELEPPPHCLAGPPAHSCPILSRDEFELVPIRVAVFLRPHSSTVQPAVIPTTITPTAQRAHTGQP